MNKGYMKYNLTNLNFKREVFFQVFNDHHQEWQLDAKCFLWVGGTSYVRGANISPHDLEHKALDVVVRNPLNMSITNLFVPDLQRFAAYAVKN